MLTIEVIVDENARTNFMRGFLKAAWVFTTCAFLVFAVMYFLL